MKSKAVLTKTNYTYSTSFGCTSESYQWVVSILIDDVIVLTKTFDTETEASTLALLLNEAWKPLNTPTS